MAIKLSPIFRSSAVKKYFLPGVVGSIAALGAERVIDTEGKPHPYVVPAAVLGGTLGAGILRHNLKDSEGFKKLLMKLPRPAHFRPDVYPLMRESSMPYVLAGTLLGAAAGRMIPLEKSAGPLASMIEWGGEKLLGSAFGRGAIKVFGSQATSDALMASKKLAPDVAENFANKVKSLLPAGRQKIITAPKILSGANELKDQFTIRDYAAKAGGGFGGAVKGLGSYIKNEVLSGPGTGFGAFRDSITKGRYGIGAAGTAFKKSPVSANLNLAADAYFVGQGAFGKLEPGQTRQGAMLGGLGFVVGQRSARKELAGMIRGFGSQYAGQKIGDKVFSSGAGPSMIPPMLPKMDPPV